MIARARKGPLVLVILDGWGTRHEAYGNAILNADTPTWDHILATYPNSELEASGEPVGLPAGVMGNSEVGHLNIGSGRTVPQGVVIINESLANGSFAKNATLAICIEHAKKRGGTLHFMGLLSDGSVHSSIDHLLALVNAATAGGAKIAVHPFGDGRDVPPSSMQKYLDTLEAHLAQAGAAGAIATLTGRFYAMDRDKRWERTELAYDALANAKSEFHAATASEALAAAYARGETDEFVKPTIVGEARPIEDGDAVVFFNFRPRSRASDDPRVHAGRLLGVPRQRICGSVVRDDDQVRRRHEKSGTLRGRGRSTIRSATRSRTRASRKCASRKPKSTRT